VIRADGLHKYFTNVHAVDNLSLEVRRGEIFGLLGPNGAGKSTTIRMIVNVISPDEGTITYDDKPFEDAVRERIGYLPEERGLYQKAGILETIVHFARLKGLDSPTATSRARTWMERFGLGGNDRRKVQELSKGNQQKVQIIIALMHDPEYVILDEPTSGLDPVNQELLQSIVEELRDQGRTIVYSTHRMDLAERLCDRIALINRGRVVLSGEVEAVRSRHGGNTVVVEFEGDGRFLADLPGVLSADVHANVAELKMAADAHLNVLLPLLAERLEVSRVERVRPSLNSIFIETVGADNVPVEMLQRHRAARETHTAGGVL